MAKNVITEIAQRTTANEATKSAGPTGGSRPVSDRPGFGGPTPAAAAPTPPPVPTDAKGFQQYLNNDPRTQPKLKVDGIIGPKTLAAAQKLNVTVPPNLAPAAPTTASLPVSQPSGTVPEPEAAAPAEAIPAEIPRATVDEIRARYGYLGALLDQPDIAQIIASYDSRTESDDQLLARLRNTPTFQSHSQNQLNWLALMPADQQERIAQQTADITNQAAAIGVTIDPARVAQLAQDSLASGWDATQIRNAIASEFHYRPGGQTGTLAAAEANIRAAAQQYNVSDLLGDDVLASYDAQIAEGTATADSLKQKIVELAQQRFPGLAAQITVDNPTSNALAPYKNLAAQELGVNPDTIDFRDPKWNVAVNQIDDKGQHAPMGLADWQRLLRSDSTYGWENTVNGKTAYAQLAVATAQTLGLRA